MSRVGTKPTAAHANPAAAAGPGGYVLVWNDTSQSWAQRIDTGGTPQGSRFPVGTGTGSGYVVPSKMQAVALAGSVGFVVVWSERRAGAGDVFVSLVDLADDRLHVAGGHRLAQGNVLHPCGGQERIAGTAQGLLEVGHAQVLRRADEERLRELDRDRLEIGRGGPGRGRAWLRWTPPSS